MTRWMLDATADTLPPGLIGTPFEAVYRALRDVAAGVWDVDPAAYRAGIAWAFYLLERPALLERLPALVAAALVSEGVPAIRPDQTPAELVALLRVWFSYRPTYARLEALLACYGVEAEVRPISDPDCQRVLPVQDTRLAFYIRVLGMDWARPLTADEIAEIARLASPLGARPVPFYAFQAGEAPVYVASAGAGIVYSLLSGAVAQAVPGVPVGGTIDATSQTAVYIPRDVGGVTRSGFSFVDKQLEGNMPDDGGTVSRSGFSFVDKQLEGSMPMDGGTVSADATLFGYFTNQGQTGENTAVDTWDRGGYIQMKNLIVYDASGNAVAYDSGKNYVVVSAWGKYDGSDEIREYPSGILSNVGFAEQSGNLTAHCSVYSYGDSPVYISKIEYTE